jgi:hypothetical protein
MLSFTHVLTTADVLAAVRTSAFAVLCWVQAVGFLLMPLCSSMLALVAAFGTVALSWNIINTAGNTYVLWIAAEAAAARAARSGTTSTESSSVLINTVNAAFGAGSLAAPVVAELCATKLDRPLAAYWITAACTAVSAASFLLLPSPNPPGTTSSTGSSGTQQVGAAAEGTGADGSSLQQPLLADSSSSDAAVEVAAAADAAAGSSAAAAAPQQADWWSGTLLLLLGVTALFNLLNVGTEVGFGGWIFTYATKQAGLSEHEGHAVNAAYWAFFTLGRVLASFASLVLSPATLLFGSLPLALLGALAALLAPAAMMQTQGWMLLMGVTVLIGLGVSAGFANSLALLDSYCPCTGSITGLLGGVAGAGCMTIPLVVALLAKHTALQYQGLMWVCLTSFAVQLACVPLVLAVGRRLKREQAAKAVKDLDVSQDGTV